MKIFIFRRNKQYVDVLARNLKTCKREMKCYTDLKFHSVLQSASNWRGDLGIYRYRRVKK